MIDDRVKAFLLPLHGAQAKAILFSLSTIPTLKVPHPELEYIQSWHAIQSIGASIGGSLGSLAWWM